MANILDKLISKRNGNEIKEMVPALNLLHHVQEVETGNMNQMGYTMAGRHNGDSLSLNNAFELIKSGQIVDENNNEDNRQKVIGTLENQISELRNTIPNHKTIVDKINQVEIPGIESEVEKNKQRIAEIKAEARNNKFQRNRFNLILLWAGFVLGFFYLYLFYVSAIHSALFRNIAGEVANTTTDNVGLLLNNVFNVTAFKEFNIHWVAPIIFFIFAVILHFALEIRTKVTRYLSVFGVVIFVLIADGLLAYFIEKNNHLLSQLMGLSDYSWAFYKSSGFYLVLFFGFFTSMGWSIILHKLAREFESGNPERKAEDEVRAIEKSLRQLSYDKGVATAKRIDNINAIALIEDKVKTLEVSKSNVHYSLIALENNLDDFYNGWLSYLNGLKSDSNKKQECENVYLRFKSEKFSKSLTA